MPSERLLHFVPYDAPGRHTAQALCGQYVNRRFDHSPQPTCPTCAAEQAAYETADVGQGDGPHPVKFAE
jgi:hypothetical protein